jgi:hypothetical protein
MVLNQTSAFTGNLLFGHCGAYSCAVVVLSIEKL